MLTAALLTRTQVFTTATFGLCPHASA